MEAQVLCQILNESSHMVSLLSCFWARQISQDVPANVGFLCDKAAVLGDKIKGTLYILNSFYSSKVKDSFKVILHPRLNPFSLDFSDNIPCIFLTSVMHSTGPAHLIRIDLMIIGQIGYCEPHSCNFLNTTGSQLQTSSVLLSSTFIIRDL